MRHDDRRAARTAAFHRVSPAQSAAADTAGAGPAARADGAHVVPDRFLRRWDPVTVLFDADTGPAAGGPEDDPGRLVTLDAGQRPGAGPGSGRAPCSSARPSPGVRWRRWPCARRARRRALLPLLPVPDATGPADSDAGQPDLDTVALTFAEPVDAAVLARALTIELRPQPGLTTAGAQPLSPQDFDIRPCPGRARGDKQTYLVVLKLPVPDGRVAIVRLQLSDEPGLDDPTFETRIRSAAPFALSDAYCGGGYDHSTRDGMVRCDPSDATAGPRMLTVQLTAESAPVDIVKARDALRISPPVDDLAVTVSGARAAVAGEFRPDTPYEVTVAPGALTDTRGRRLARPVDVRFNFAPGKPVLNWDAAGGVVERFGPQMVPLRGHGYDRADIRIHAVDPLSRDFWPFPRQPLVTDDAKAPPLPGNEPDRWRDAGPIGGDDMAARVQALGTPARVDAGEPADPARRGGQQVRHRPGAMPEPDLRVRRARHLPGRAAHHGRPHPALDARAGDRPGADDGRGAGPGPLHRHVAVDGAAGARAPACASRACATTGSRRWRRARPMRTAPGRCRHRWPPAATRARPSSAASWSAKAATRWCWSRPGAEGVCRVGLAAGRGHLAGLDGRRHRKAAGAGADCCATCSRSGRSTARRSRC